MSGASAERASARSPGPDAIINQEEQHLLPSVGHEIGAKVKGRAMKANGRAIAKNTICLWYDKDAEAAARFYAKTFPKSTVGAIFRAPSDYPSGKKGDVLTVEFTVAGIPCIGLNGGPQFRP